MFIKLCKYQQTTYIMFKKATPLKIHYRHYPEYMFAIIASYLPSREGDDLRRVAGKVEFRHDRDWCTYKNGLLHSYNELPVYTRGKYQVWYRDGKLHREADRPAIINRNYSAWFKNGLLDREGDLPVIIDLDSNRKEWYKEGIKVNNNLNY